MIITLQISSFHEYLEQGRTVQQDCVSLLRRGAFITKHSPSFLPRPSVLSQILSPASVSDKSPVASHILVLLSLLRVARLGRLPEVERDIQPAGRSF